MVRVLALSIALSFIPLGASDEKTTNGCVGAIAGIPLHDVEDGASARDAMLPALVEARAYPASWLIPGSLIFALGDRVLLVDDSGTMTLLAGGPAETNLLLPKAGSVLVGTSTSIYNPHVAPAPSGKLIISDGRGAILSLDLGLGLITLLAGDPVAGSGWSPDGTRAVDARIYGPDFVEVSQRTGDVYFFDRAPPEDVPVIRVIRASGLNAGRIVTVAGNGSLSYAVEGALASQSGFYNIVDAFFDDATGDLLVAELGPWVLHGFISNSRVSGGGGDACSVVVSITRAIHFAFRLCPAPCVRFCA